MAKGDFSFFLVSFNTESFALEIVKLGRGDICSSRGIIFPTHNNNKKKDAWKVFQTHYLFLTSYFVYGPTKWRLLATSPSRFPAANAGIGDSCSRYTSVGLVTG